MKCNMPIARITLITAIKSAKRKEKQKRQQQYRHKIMCLYVVLLLPNPFTTLDRIEPGMASIDVYILCVDICRWANGECSTVKSI